jgi:hypothetical protein
MSQINGNDDFSLPLMHILKSNHKKKKKKEKKNYFFSSSQPLVMSNT